eukprot:scaffold178327_cov51-Attheya_sp.AAC.1
MLRDGDHPTLMSYPAVVTTTPTDTQPMPTPTADTQPMPTPTADTQPTAVKRCPVYCCSF